MNAVDVGNLLDQAAPAGLIDAARTFVRLELAGYSPVTITWYTRLLGRLAADLQGIDLSSLSPFHIKTWQANLYDRKLSPYTVRAYLLAARRLFRWMHSENLLLVDLAGAIRLPKLPKAPAKGLANQVADQVLDAAKDNPRDYALILFLESTGCRRAGAANLTIDDLMLDSLDERLRRRALVNEKGSKTRSVIMSNEAMDALQAWLLQRPESDDLRVFQLSPTGVSEVLRRYARRLGIKGSISPHQWRHRLSRTLIQSGLDISQAAQLLGHEKVDTTERHYGQFAIDSLQDAYDRARGKSNRKAGAV